MLPSFIRATLAEHRVDSYAAMSQAQIALPDLDLTGPVALIVGSEGQGVSDFFRHSATGVRIPTAGVESLNAAMAAGVLLYEASRQRLLEPDLAS